MRRRSLIPGRCQRVMWLLVALACGSPVVASESRRAAVNSLLARGATRLADDLSGALDAFLQAQRMSPASPLPHVAVGLAALLAGDFEAAESEFALATELDSTDALSRHGLAMLALYRGDAETAIRRLDEVEQLSPHWPAVHAHRALALCAVGRPAQALMECRKAEDLGGGSAVVDQVKGLAFFLLKRYDSAIGLAGGLGGAREREAGLFVCPRIQLADAEAPLLRELQGGSQGLVLEKQRRLAREADLESAARSLNSAVWEPPPLAQAAPAIPVEPITVTDGDGVEPLRGMAVVALHGDFPDSMQYVMFIVDGQTRAITNSEPYSWQWTTTADRDGEHVVSARFFDRAGMLLREVRRTVRVGNRAAQAPAPVRMQELGPSAEQVRALLRRVAVFRASDDNRRAITAAAVRAKNLMATLQARTQPVDEPPPSPAPPPAPTIQDGPPPNESVALRDVDLWGVKTDGEKVVALTFDDGPRPFYTQRILELLDSYAARSTFFMVGKMVDAYPALARQIVSAGHEIGSHSYHHEILTQMPREEMEADLKQADESIRRATHVAPHLFRPPGGHYDDAVRETAARLGYRSVFWTANISSFDDLAGPTVARKLLDLIHPGAIVLLHNGRDKTLPALPHLLAALRARGYRFVTVSELLRLGVRLPSRSATSATYHTPN